MEFVNQYLKHCRECRDAAQQARSKTLKEQFAKAAEIWEQMAKERLRLLQLRCEVLGPPEHSPE